MNSPEAQYQLAKKMPTASLANILRGIPGAIDQGIAMMVLGERQRMKTASQGQQAGAEAQQPSVKDRMLLAQQGQLPENQGIGMLPSPNMGQVAAMAQGGVVGFAGGGDVQHFQVGGASYVEGPPSYLTTPEEIADYACEDADITFQLKQLLEPEIQKPHLYHLFYDMEMPLVQVLKDIEQEGIAIDTAALDQFSKELDSRITELDQEILDAPSIIEGDSATITSKIR
jgi:hypothetical protein